MYPDTHDPLVVGKTEQEILYLFGQPDEKEGVGWVYYMGTNPRHPDAWKFYIEFGKNGKADMVAVDRTD